MLAKPQMWWPGINRQHPLARGLVALWPFWTMAGSHAANIVRPGWGQGTLQGGTSWAGQGIQFNGSTGYVSVANGALDIVEPFSVVALVRSTSFAAGRTIFSVSDSAKGNYQHALIVCDGGDPAGGDDLCAFTRNSATFSPRSGISTKPLTLNTWHPVAGVWSSSALRTGYVHGGNPGTNTADVPLTGLNNTEIGRFGDSSPNWQWIGDMAYLGLYNRGLSASEVLAWAVHGYDLTRPPSIARRHVPAVGGLSIPIAMHHYKQMMGAG